MKVVIENSIKFLQSPNFIVLVDMTSCTFQYVLIASSFKLMLNASL